MKGAQALVQMLKEYQVKVIFGVPGDTSVPLYKALSEAGSDIKHVLARDERSASFMADAYARLSHKPGFCEVPSGAGPLYAAPGIAEANASSIPVVLITSDIPLSGEGKLTITELDTQGLFRSITKWSSLVKQPGKVPETIRRAMRIATTGRPGAVHLAFPTEVMEGGLEADGRIYAEDECNSYPAYRTRGARTELERLTDLITRAKRPVIIAGGGANHSQAGQTMAALAEWLSIPVVTTISGQGIINDNHRLALGVIGDNGYHPHAHRAVEQGDVLLYVGCKMGSVSTINWTMPGAAQDRHIIQIDLNPEILGNNFRNTLSVAGDARLILEDVLLLVKDRLPRRDESAWSRGLNEARAGFWKAAQEEFALQDVPLKAQPIISELNKHLDGPAIVISDAGTPTPYTSRYLRLGGGGKDKGSRFLIPRSYGGLGYAIPALVGAHFARPDAKLVGLFGDGSLGMSAGEMETLARLNIPAVLIHFNNGSFGWIKCLQKLHSNENYFSVDFTRGDPTLIARGCGLKALHIETPSELAEGMAQAFASQGPVFLDLVTEPEIDCLPPVYTWQQAAAKAERSR